jgi:NitT/TauT family transport system substrate-binding protein
MIAVDQGFFASEGLDVDVVNEYPSGKIALQGLFRGEVQITVCAETPIVFHSFEREDFRVIATVGSSDNEPKIVARKDRGIQNLADLQGKRVATQRASAVHYFLHLVLLKNQIPETELQQLMFCQAEDLPSALASGKIDAFSMREPYVGEAQRLLRNDAVVLSEPGLYVKTMNLVARESVVASHPGVIHRVVRALLLAEEYAREQPEKAQACVAARLGISKEAIAELWPQLSLRVSLGQELVQALDDEARWAIDNSFVNAEHVPNYLELLMFEAMEAVKPVALTVVR